MKEIDYRKSISKTMKYTDNRSYAHGKTSGESLFLLIILATILSGAGKHSVAGFNLCGWAWLIVLFFSVGYVFLKRKRVVPSVWLAWLPFFSYILFRSDITYRDDIQRICIIISPVFVGMAISSLRFKNLKKIQLLYYFMLFATVANYLLAVIQNGELNGFSSWNIPQGFCMTLTLTAIVGIVDWTRGIKRGLLALCLSYAVCFLTVSRMPILTIPFLILFGPFSISLRKRVVIVILLCLAAIYAFTMQPVRENIFRKHSGLQGTGTYEDIIELDPSVISSGGRLNAWPYYLEMIKKKPFFGYGGTETVKFGNLMFGGWSHPHNDYIRLLFDYGMAGLLLYLWPYILLLVKCYRQVGVGSADVEWLYRVSSGGLLAGLLLMITGNTIMYVAWFGNLLFATVGAAFSATASLSGSNESHPSL